MSGKNRLQRPRQFILQGLQILVKLDLLFVRLSGLCLVQLHELVRQYVASKLGDDDWASVSERHSRYYLDWLGRARLDYEIAVRKKL